jgi:hypothetical protein
MSGDEPMVFKSSTCGPIGNKDSAKEKAPNFLATGENFSNFP